MMRLPDQPYTVRRLVADAPYLMTIADWYQREWPDRGGEERLPWLNRLTVSDCEALLVAERDGQAAGAVAMIECDNENYRQFTPWVAALYVAKEHRREGIASLLLDGCKAWGTAKGLGEIYLYATTGFRTKLYAREGFETIATFEKNGRSYEVMACRLKDEPLKNR